MKRTCFTPQRNPGRSCDFRWFFLALLMLFMGSRTAYLSEQVMLELFCPNDGR